MKKSTRLSLIGIATFAAIVTSNIPTAQAQSGSIGGRPANPQANNERTKSIFIAQLAAGASKTDAIEVVNNTGEVKEVLVYSVDSVPSSGGAFACAQAVDTPSSVGKWIRLSQTSVTLPPNEKQIVPFTIAVPDGVGPGEQNGCIVLQEKKTSTFQGGIGLNFRTAIRVAVLVPGDVRKELTATGIGFKLTVDKIVISPQVKNTGNVSVDSLVTTRISSVLGLKVDEQINTFPVLRDQTTEWNFEFKRPFWGGLYRASYDLSYDQSKTGYIGDAAQKSDATVLSGPSKWFVSAPQPLALAIELLALVLIVAVIARYTAQKTHKRRVSSTWTAYTVSGNEQLQDIAKNHNVAWKKLASSNHLKAPYHLSAGQQIKVPPAKKPSRKPTKPTS